MYLLSCTVLHLSVCSAQAASTSGGAAAASLLETPPSMSLALRSPATSATPTPVVSLHAGDSSTDTTLSTVGCVYFADTFLLSGEFLLHSLL